MKIYIGADHNGFALKNDLADYLSHQDFEVIDKGDKTLNPSDDFPIYARRVVEAVIGSEDEARGILLCGSGQGMVIAANRFKGIRAAVVWDIAEAKVVRNDDDSNVLCLPARLVDLPQVKLITDTWLVTPFAGAPRFVRRINEMDRLG